MGAIFVGRARELSALDALRHRATAGESITALVEAPAGGGKSALLEQFASRTAAELVVRVSGDEAETTLAYGVDDQLAEQLSGARTKVDASLQGRGEALRDRLHRACHDRGGLVVIMDDAQLADRASLAALGYALRRLPGEPILTLLAARPNATEVLPQGLVRLAAAEDTQLTLDGLSVDDIRTLAAHYGHRDVAERAARRLRDHTGGNPLYVRALLRDRRLGSAIWLSTPLPAPSQFAHLVAARLAALSPGARRLARAGAVLGGHSDLAAAAAMAELAEPLPPADELRTAQVARLASTAYAVQLVFEHSMIRAAVLQDCPDAELAELHRAAAAHTRGAEALRHRAQATAGHDRELAAGLEQQARRDITRGGWRMAADALLAAARLHPDPAARDRLLAGGVYALLVARDLAIAIGYRDQVAALPESAAQLQALALIGWLTGDFAAAEEFAERAWRFAPDLTPLERDRLAGLRTQMSVLQGDGADARRWSQSALDSGLLDPTMRASTVATLVGGMILEGQVDEARGLLPATGDLDDAGYRELIGMRGLISVLCDDPVAAAADLRVRLQPNLGDHRRGPSPLELLTAIGPDGIEPNKLVVLVFLVEAEFRRGRWDVAAAIEDQTLSLIEDTEQTWMVPWARAVAVLVPAARGQWALAENHLRIAQETAARLGNDLNRGYTADAAVHLASCRSDPEQVVAAACWLLDSGTGYQQEPGAHSWPVHYAEALVALGREDEAEKMITRWEVVARRRGHRSRLAALARVRGELAVRRRDLTGARQAFQTALDRWTGLTEEVDALEHAVAHLDYGRFLRRRGERRTAVAELTEAERRFAALEATPFLDAARRELAACGVEPGAPAEPSALASLTPQEAAVARLVAGGSSNREIAETLVLSTKTVAYHLGHVYAKVGVRSRSQLIARRLFDAPDGPAQPSTAT